jgi:leader peptidase (prepilin peptidase) / N-methyltransferase
MNLFFYLFVFIFGLVFGSFLNCLVYRLETGKSFLRGRSFCPNCLHLLSWRDLLPVFSFILLRGKCRYCRKAISLQYPLLETAAGLLFVLTVFYFSFDFLFSFFYLIFSCFLIVIFVYDLKHYIIPDRVIYPAIVLAFLYQLIEGTGSLAGIGRYSLFSAVGAAAFFLSVVLVSHGRWMGVGDIKLAFLMGLLLGWPNILVALFLAFFIGAVVGLGLMVSGQKGLKSEIPFGPFLVTGTFLALFWGSQLLSWYQAFFLLK